jgi:hypothetical protein
MKKYYIDEHIRYCYPYKAREIVKEYGVLKEYIGKEYSRDEIDKIICELIMRHPYIENSMHIDISIMWKENNTIGYYHTLSFQNDNDEKQKRGSSEIKYEK